MGTVRPPTDFAGYYRCFGVDTPTFCGEFPLSFEKSRVWPGGYVCGRRENGRKHEITPRGG
jgi:hypothetical protein